MPRIFPIPTTSPVDLLIIGHQAFAPLLKRYADFKTGSGIPARFISVERIRDAFDGRDDPEKIRNCVREAHEHAGTSFVLLAGDVKQVPTRYVYNPEKSTILSDNVASAYTPTDSYYADLYSAWDSNSEGVYGRSKYFNTPIGNDDGGFRADVFVGRIPAKGIERLNIVLNKLKRFEGWTRETNSLFLGTSDQPSEIEPDPVVDAKASYNVFMERGFGGARLDAIREDLGNLSCASALHAFNSARPTIIASAHGLPFGLLISSGRAHELSPSRGAYIAFSDLRRREKDVRSLFPPTSTDSPVIVRSDIQELNNEAPYLLVMSACYTCMFDYPYGYSLGESFLMQRNGALAFIGQARHEFGPIESLKQAYLLEEGGQSEELLPLVVANVYLNDWPIGKAFHLARVEYACRHPHLMSEEYQRRSLFGYNLLGDPTMKLYKEPRQG